MKQWDNQYPNSSEYSHFYSTYVQEVPRANIIETLNAQMHEFYTLVNAVPGHKAFDAYEDGKWTIKQVVGHVIDAERVFAYRAHRISRGDTTPLSGFDQNDFVDAANFDDRTLANLANEYLAVRISTIHLFQNMTSKMIDAVGNASGVDVSVKALAFIIAGHQQHHTNVLQTKYLV